MKHQICESCGIYHKPESARCCQCGDGLRQVDVAPSNVIRADYHEILPRINAAIQLPGLRAYAVLLYSDGAANVLMEYEPHESYVDYFSTSPLCSVEQAEEFAMMIATAVGGEEDELNILKQDKLFPHITGSMLKLKPAVLTLSGQVKVVDMPDGGARCEIFFTDHTKSAIINRTQLMKIVDAYGPETDDWRGKRVRLFGEEGVWFGKRQWGVRVAIPNERTAPTPVQPGQEE